jgi:hypothetical protein
MGTVCDAAVRCYRLQTTIRGKPTLEAQSLKQENDAMWLSPKRIGLDSRATCCLT